MEKAIDFRLFKKDVSIKTCTFATKDTELIPHFKVTWSSDRDECREYVDAFKPHYDIFFLPIQWGATNDIFYFTRMAQHDILTHLGKDEYFKIGSGKDPKGGMITTKATRLIAKHPTTLKMPIKWPATNDEIKSDKIEIKCNNIISDQAAKRDCLLS